MGIASMVIGIVSLILSFITYGSCISIIASPIGLVLGIVDLVTKNKNGEAKRMTIAGIILNALTIVILIVLFIIAIFASAYLNY